MNNFSFDFQLHWLTVVVFPSGQEDAVDHCRSMLEGLFGGCKLEDIQRGAQGYEHLELWNGIRLCHGGNNGTICMSMSGDWVSSLSIGSLRGFFRDLKEQGLEWRCSRIDLAFDLEDEGQTIQEVYQAVQDRLYICRSAQRGAYIDFDSDDKTVTIGSRASTRYMRIYNRRGYTRIELEIKAEAAGYVGALLFDQDSLSGYGKLIRLGVGVLKDFIEFKSEFWKVFEEFSKAGYKVSCGTASTMDRSKQNIEKRIAATLAALYAVYGMDWLKDVLWDGAMDADKKIASWGYGDLDAVQCVMRLLNKD
jgi:hypothetical protein